MSITASRKYTFNARLFASMLRARRGEMSLRQVEDFAGVSPSTLSRAENGKTPDVITFATLCGWLGEEPAQFFIVPMEQK